MTIEAAILRNIENLPDTAKESLLLYTEFLANHYRNLKSAETSEQLKKRRLFGSMKGTFILPLPDNFDGPLDDFKDYL